MSMQERIDMLLRGYTRLRSESAADDLPTMRIGVPEQHTEMLDDPAAAWDTLANHSPREGWFQCQSYQSAFRNGLPKADATWGLLLAAEAVDAEGTEVALRRTPAGRWALRVTRHRGEGHGLWDEVRHVAHNPAFGALRYRRYWTLDPVLGAVQADACFLGFDIQE